MLRWYLHHLILDSINRDLEHNLLRGPPGIFWVPFERVLILMGTKHTFVQFTMLLLGTFTSYFCFHLTRSLDDVKCSDFLSGFVVFV